MNDDRSEVVVVGGGLGGLAAALGLAQRGRSVTVVEPRTNPVPDRWGFTLWPPAVRGLAQLGVAERVAARGNTLQTMRLLSARGREWMGLPLSHVGDDSRFIGVRPSEVERVLAEAAVEAGVCILAGHRFVHLSHGAGGVELLVQGEGGVRQLIAQVVVAADGPRSTLRSLIGGESRRFQPPGQTVFTGIGAAVPAAESRQTIGDGWSVGTVALGAEHTWVFAVFEEQDPMALLEQHRAIDPALHTALLGFVGGARLQPFSAQVPQWATDRLVLVGDAAHPLLPQLGLGGSQTLEDVPVLVDVLDRALRSGDLSEAALGEFQRRRRDRVAYARRITDLWAVSCTGRSYGLGMLRDLNLLRISLRPESMVEFMTSLAGDTVPPLRQRLAVGIP